MSIGRRKRNLFTCCSLFLIAALTACEHAAPGAQRGQRSVVDVILTVHNESRHAAEVALASETARVVLGDLASGASRSFSIPSALAASPSKLRLEAVADGGAAIRSEEFQVHRGQQILWSFAAAGPGSVITR